MDALSLAALVTSPALVFSLAVALFLLAVRSPWPWTRTGGAVLGLLAAAAVAGMVVDPRSRRLLLSPERLPIAVLTLASAAAVWTAVYQARRPPSGAEAAGAWRGLGRVELLAGGAVVLAVAVAAFALGAPLAPPADPHAAGPAEAPWFLLAVAQMRSFFDPWVATVLLPLLTVAGLFALPYLDVAKDAADAGFEERRDVVYFIVFVWFLLALLPMAGAILPWARIAAAGSPELARPEAARPFSDLLWGLIVEIPPRQAWLRELPAVVLLGAYFFALPSLLPRWRPTRALFGRYRKRLGRRRFHLAVVLIELWMLVPLKMYGRWLLGIGYFVHLPELGFNL